MITVCNNLARRPIRLGLVFAEVLSVRQEDGLIRSRVDAFHRTMLEGEALSESRRLAARDMLRNGKFKPTGRSKPASEYLLRTVREKGPDGFPRINPVVDVINYVSLANQAPLSLWDLDRAGTNRYVFRHGKEGEAYVFNRSGQSIDLTDLAVGCATDPHSDVEHPIVNPVKDSMATKTHDESSRFGIVVYAPPNVFSEDDVLQVLAELTSLLDSISSGVTYGSAVLDPGSMSEIRLTSR